MRFSPVSSASEDRHAKRAIGESRSHTAVSAEHVRTAVAPQDPERSQRWTQRSRSDAQHAPSGEERHDEGSARAREVAADGRRELHGFACNAWWALASSASTAEVRTAWRAGYGAKQARARGTRTMRRRCSRPARRPASGVTPSQRSGSDRCEFARSRHAFSLPAVLAS